MMSRFQLKLGSHVVVSAKGTKFEGVVKSMSENEIVIQSPMRSWTLHFDEIQKIEEKKSAVPLNRTAPLIK